MSNIEEEAKKKAMRQAAAKNASDAVIARNTALIKFAVGECRKKNKPVTASNVSKLAGISEATSRDYLQKMNLLEKRVVKTTLQKERLAKAAKIIEVVVNYPKCCICVWGKDNAGKEAWTILDKSEF